MLPLRKFFDYLTGSSLTDDGNERNDLLQDILDRRWAILIASVCVAATAAVTVRATHSIWPLVWFLADAVLAAARWAVISRALRAAVPERRQLGYVLASLSLLWSSLFGFAMVLLVRSGDQGLFILASIMTVSVASAISSRNAPMPRTAILAISFSAVPFLVAIGLFLPEQKWIALVAGFPLLVSLWSLTLQNHQILVRLIIAERRAQLLANTDALTGLPNCLSFLRHQDSLSVANGAKGGYAYMCLDLDGFKAVNDNHGHPAGDLLLKAVAQRLKDTTRATDITFRIGGDEFIVYMPEATLQECSAVAARIIECMAQPFDLSDSLTVGVGCSAGSACFNDSSPSASLILKAADEALYKAKAAGKRRHIHAACDENTICPAC